MFPNCSTFFKNCNYRSQSQWVIQLKILLYWDLDCLQNGKITPLPGFPVLTNQATGPENSPPSLLSIPKLSKISQHSNLLKLLSPINIPQMLFLISFPKTPPISTTLLLSLHPPIALGFATTGPYSSKISMAIKPSSI